VARSADRAPFDYPGDGSVAHVGAAELRRGIVVLRDISVYGGAVTADAVAVPLSGGEPQVAALEVDGHPVAARPNTIVVLGGGSYLVAEQTAVDTAGEVGGVGLRLVLNDGQHGVAPGSQLLLGLPFPPRARPATAAAAAAPGLGVLGLPLAPSERWQSLTLPAPVSLPSSRGERAARIALQFLGIPYVWAGATPAGFDCSGLTMYVYARLGVSLLHFSGAQWSQGTRVPAGGLQPGDLVFFDMGALGPGHVGIYIGNGRFVHAPHTGDVVKISSLSDAGYAMRYVGAVRP